MKPTHYTVTVVSETGEKDTATFVDLAEARDVFLATARASLGGKLFLAAHEREWRQSLASLEINPALGHYIQSTAGPEIEGPEPEGQRQQLGGGLVSTSR